MPYVLTDSQNYSDIADAINQKLGTSNEYYPSEMAAAILTISGGGGSGGIDSPITFVQINDIASAFLSDTTYENEVYDDSSTSSVNFQSSVMSSTYRPQAVSIAEGSNPYRTDEPVPKSLQIRQNGTLHIVDDLTHIKSENVTSGTYNFYNVTPNVVAYYIDEANGRVSQCGSLTGTGQIRMIHTTSGNGELSHNFTGANIRDIGGWACDGGYIKYGKIIRGIRFNGFSSSAIHISEHDLNTFRNLIGIRSEIDLRSDSEISTVTGSAFGDDIVWHHYALQDYVNSLINNQIEYRDIFKQIAYDVSHNNPIYMHCMAGCDRTGTTCALLEGLLGVARYNIDKDYELSSLVNYKFRTGSSQGQVNDQFNRFRTNSSWGTFIRYLNNNYTGSTFRDKVIDYLLSIGVTLDEINTIRQSLIDGNPEIITGYSVTYNLDHTTSSNTSSSILPGSFYTTTISVDSGYQNLNITVIMNNTDITSSAVSGNSVSISQVTGNLIISASATAEEVWTISASLFDVDSSNNSTSVIKNDSYNAVLTPGTGCIFSNTDIVTCTMGGSPVTITDGTGDDSGKKIISIPQVTGNLIISASATHVDILTNSYFSHGKLYSAVGLAKGYRFKSDGSIAAEVDYAILGTASSNDGYVYMDSRDRFRLYNTTVPTSVITGNYFKFFYQDDSVIKPVPSIVKATGELRTDATTVGLAAAHTISGSYICGAPVTDETGTYIPLTISLGFRETTTYAFYTNGYGGGEVSGVEWPSVSKAEFVKMSFGYDPNSADPEIYLYGPASV